MADEHCDAYAVLSRFAEFILCDHCVTMLVDIATTSVSFKVFLSQEFTINRIYHSFATLK